jgi:hypothetical protein
MSGGSVPKSQVVPVRPSKLIAAGDVSMPKSIEFCSATGAEMDEFVYRSGK